MIINKRKNCQIEINKKPPNPVGNWGKSILSLSLKAYYFLHLLLKLWSGRPGFHLVLQGWAVKVWTIMGRDHRDMSHCWSSYRESSYCGSVYCGSTHHRSTIVGWAIEGAISIRGKAILEKKRTTDWWWVKYLLTQWELRRKTKVEKIL